MKNKMVTTETLISDLEYRNHKKTREVASNFTQHITNAIMTKTKYLQVIQNCHVNALFNHAFYFIFLLTSKYAYGILNT